MKINILDYKSLGGLSDMPFTEFQTEPKDHIYIIRNYIDTTVADRIREICRNMMEIQDPTWLPCLDGVTDYHRIHDNYKNAHVKSVQHGYYFHPWNSGPLQFEDFKEIFELKLKIGNIEPQHLKALLKNIPSDGTIVRLVVHQYPRGGGGQVLHVDPVSQFARIQSIVILSERNKDYYSGGLYIEHQRYGKIELDPLLQKGDLILLSPDVPHGVAPIDAKVDCDWDAEDGRWIILPIMISSDHIQNANKPSEI